MGFLLNSFRNHFHACRSAFFDANRLVINDANVNPVRTRAMKKNSKSSFNTSKVREGVTWVKKTSVKHENIIINNVIFHWITRKNT